MKLSFARVLSLSRAKIRGYERPFVSGMNQFPPIGRLHITRTLHTHVQTCNTNTYVCVCVRLESSAPLCALRGHLSGASPLLTKGSFNWHFRWQHMTRRARNCIVTHSPAATTRRTAVATLLFTFCKYSAVEWRVLSSSCHFGLHLIDNNKNITAPQRSQR